MLDLWPNDITVDDVAIKSPVNILREQAVVLGQKTRNLVKARVALYERPTSNISTQDAIRLGYIDHDDFLRAPTEPLELSSKQFQYSFELVAPILDNYTYLLFVVFHEVDFYPVRVKLAKSLSEGSQLREFEVENERAFLDTLSDIFKLAKTRKVIQALIAQSTSFPTDA